ncbi:MAG TPA: 3-oxoacyl-[acyl-carrier-protein] synthase III C-terminal domain-containing protein [Candidatus Kryptonia bacterium]|nr:3-oxoacyl-[acyl-carrier-protein] synthase III C-terminal domain-containing protein [Candidatus Kryptonia bacterium]
MRTALLGLGHHLPPLTEAAGVCRPIAASGGSSDLAVPAAHAALAQAGLAADAADFIVFATMTPDVTFPGGACFFQHKLQAGTVGALDVRGQCAGFLFGLSVADQFVRAGNYRRVLLVGSEVLSSGLDYSPAGAKVAGLFGDGAAVAVLGPGSGHGGVLSVVIHSDGRYYDRFWCEYPASRQHPVRMTLENFRAQLHFPRLDFDAVRKFGLETLPVVIDEALAKASVAREAVDRFIISHVFPEVADEVGNQMDVSAKTINCTERNAGHLVAASLPVSLSASMTAGEIGHGATVCLAACGAGFAWGAAVVRL